MNEKERKRELARIERENKSRQKAFNDEPEETKNYILLIKEINDTFQNWGLDLTSLSSSIQEDYPIATKTINRIIEGKRMPNEATLYKLLKSYIKLEKQMVRMNFLDCNEHFRHLLYWGAEFLCMDGKDILYMIYMMLEDQLEKNIGELNGSFEKDKSKILLPNMTAQFERGQFTDINFQIHRIGNLNIIVK